MLLLFKALRDGSKMELAAGGRLICLSAKMIEKPGFAMQFIFQVLVVATE